MHLLMSSGLDAEPPISSSLQEEEDTCSHGNSQSQPMSSSVGNSPDDGDLRDDGNSTVEAESTLEASTEQSSINSRETGITLVLPPTVKLNWFWFLSPKQFLIQSEH